MNRLKAILLVLVIMFTLASCNYKTVDTVYQFDYAIIRMPNGEIVEGKIISWRDYEDGEQLQLKLEDGNTYLVNSFYTALIKYG